MTVNCVEDTRKENKIWILRFMHELQTQLTYYNV